MNYSTSTHAYIKHLLQDIKKAHRPEVPEITYAENAYSETSFCDEMENDLLAQLEFDAHMEEIERYVSEDPPHSLSHYSELNTEDFPPAHLISQKDLKRLCKALHEFYFTWNISVDLPDNLPLNFSYKLLLDCLDKKTFIGYHGTYHFDFCTGNPEGCELQEFCPCLKVWKGV